MTARLTDDEIRKLRYYRDACVHSPEWRLTFMGIPMDTALDRLLDELLEHREREAAEIAVANALGGLKWTEANPQRPPVIDVRMPMPKETDR
jgi:hypothetical protein